MKAKLKGGAEYDALTRARHRYGWKAGTIHKIKRGFWRRMRRIARVALEGK